MTCLIRWLYINRGNKWISLFCKTQKYGCFSTKAKWSWYQSGLTIDWFCK